MSHSKLQRLILIATVSAIAAPALALSTTDLEPAFKNTVFTTYKKSGHTAKLWLNRDGTFTATRTNGQKTSGHWKIKDDKICLNQDKPIPVPLAFCTIVPKGGVGTSWDSSSFSGEPVRNTLVAGR